MSIACDGEFEIVVKFITNVLKKVKRLKKNIIVYDTKKEKNNQYFNVNVLVLITLNITKIKLQTIALYDYIKLISEKSIFLTKNLKTFKLLKL